jgi:hypothetical protein
VDSLVLPRFSGISGEVMQAGVSGSFRILEGIASRARSVGGGGAEPAVADAINPLRFGAGLGMGATEPGVAGGSRPADRHCYVRLVECSAPGQVSLPLLAVHSVDTGSCCGCQVASCDGRPAGISSIGR